MIRYQTKLLIGVFLLGSLPLLGQVSKEPAKKFAELETMPTVVAWDPDYSFDWVSLKLVGPEGRLVEKRFEWGESIFIEPQLEGLPDGLYVYELRIAPVLEEGFRAQMQKADELTTTRLLRDRREAGEIAPEVQSGTFYIEDGKVVDPDLPEFPYWRTYLEESLTTADSPAFFTFVDTMDRVIQGSLCVGFDCPNSPSFGFDTVRLQENNLRIHFDDTSNSASFPNNDWRLVANDSSNGGQNRFSIEDATAGRRVFTIEAGASSNSLYVDDGGKVGFKTSTPVVELHSRDGDTPTLRLEQDGSSGFTPQTWDVAGNETNFFIRDATNGSKLPFKVFPNAPTNSLTIEGTTGDIGIGTQSPAAALHLVRSGSGVAGLPRIRFDNGDSTSKWIMDVSDNEDFRISVDGSGQQEFLLEENGNLSITGTLVTGGGGTCDPGPCDGTFRSDFAVPTIDEHAAFMWEHSHLWGVGATPEGAPLNLSKKIAGILHELEVAHIYIEQLHKRLRELEAKLAKKEQ